MIDAALQSFIFQSDFKSPQEIMPRDGVQIVCENLVVGRVVNFHWSIKWITENVGDCTP